MALTAEERENHMKLTGAAALLVILAWLAFWGTVVFVAIHFISKFW